MVSSREVNISVSRWSPGSYAKVHGLTDLLCPKCPLSFSLQIVSLQSRHCCFGRAPLYRKPHPFWFVHVTVDAMVSSQKCLCSQLFWSRNGLPRCLARWNYPPGAQGRWLCTEGVTKEAPRRLPGVLSRAFNLLDPACHLKESSLCNQGCNQQLRLPRAIRMAGENKSEASTRERHSHYWAPGPAASILSSTEARTNTNLIDSFPRTTAQSISGAGRKKKSWIWHAKNDRRGK